MKQETLDPQRRRRQFRDVRQSHSRSKSLIASQLSKSVGKSRTNRQFLNERQPNSRFFNLQNQEQDSRVLKECNKDHQNHIQSLSHKNLMCVCCYNKKQTQLKYRQQMKQKRKEEQEANDLKKSLIEQNLHKQLLYESHVRQGLEQMTEYNKRLMEKHQREKMEQLDKKKQDHQEIKVLQYEFQQEKKNRLKQRLEQQESFKNKLEQQIKMVEEKTKRQSTNIGTNVFIVDAIVPKKQDDRNSAETLKAAYKQQLLRQIDAKNAKRRKQIEDQKGLSSKSHTNEFQLVTFAEKRNEEARRIASQFKLTLQNDINKKKNLEQIAKQKKQSQRLQQEKERKKITLEQQAQRLKQEDMRRQKIDNYLFDLRSQIQQNKRKRLQEIQFINERKVVEPIVKSQAVKEQVCEECHKRYPKKMLSEFVTVADS